LLVLNLLFLNQVFIDYSYVGPAWTLSLEVWLYALAHWFSKQSTRLLRWLIVISFVAFAFYTAGRSLFHWYYYSGVNWGLNLLFLSFTWIAGFLLAKDPAARKSTMRLIAVLFILEIAVEAVIQLGYRMKHHNAAIFFQEDLSGYAFMGVTLLIVWLVFRKILEPAPAGALKKSGWMRLLGDISYPLYLTHMKVFDLLPRIGVHNAWLATAISILVAFAVYLLVDFYSQRREKRKAKAALVPAA
jgi:peptidoglycan/LPS O-acetylase OafA/YrhL